MHQAPPVEYPLGNRHTLPRLACVAWFCVALIDLLWLFLADPHGWRPWLGLGATVLLGAMALFLRPADAGCAALYWDGGAWSLRDAVREVSGHVAVQLDLQTAMLVVWTPGTGRACWCWLDSAADASRWLALRRALYTPRRAGQANGAPVGPVPQA